MCLENAAVLQRLDTLVESLRQGYGDVYDAVQAGDYLAALRHMGDVRDLREEVLGLVVSLARSQQGASWRDIGKALRLHRSSVQQRFGKT